MRAVRNNIGLDGHTTYLSISHLGRIGVFMIRNLTDKANRPAFFYTLGVIR